MYLGKKKLEMWLAMCGVQFGSNVSTISLGNPNRSIRRSKSKTAKDARNDVHAYYLNSFRFPFRDGNNPREFAIFDVSTSIEIGQVSAIATPRPPQLTACVGVVPHPGFPMHNIQTTKTSRPAKATSIQHLAPSPTKICSASAALRDAQDGVTVEDINASREWYVEETLDSFLVEDKDSADRIYSSSRANSRCRPGNTKLPKHATARPQPNKEAPRQPK